MTPDVTVTVSLSEEQAEALKRTPDDQAYGHGACLPWWVWAPTGQANCFGERPRMRLTDLGRQVRAKLLEGS